MRALNEARLDLHPLQVAAKPHSRIRDTSRPSAALALRTCERVIIGSRYLLTADNETIRTHWRGITDRNYSRDYLLGTDRGALRDLGTNQKVHQSVTAVLATASRKHYGENLVSGCGSLRGTSGRRLLRRRKEQISRHTETGAQTLHHRHAQPLFATHHFTDAARGAEERDQVRSREAVLIHEVADQIGDARRPTRPFAFPRTRRSGALAPPAERCRLDHSTSIADRRARGRA